MRWRRRRRRYDRSLRPVWSMFLFGLFISIGMSPGTLIFDTAMDFIRPYISIAAVLVLIVLAYFIYDSIYSPISDLYRAFRTGGIVGTIALIFALISGLTVLFHLSGIVILGIAVLTWKLAVRYLR